MSTAKLGQKVLLALLQLRDFKKAVLFIYLFISPRLLLILMSLPPEWAVSIFRSLYRF